MVVEESEKDLSRRPPLAKYTSARHVATDDLGAGPIMLLIRQVFTNKPSEFVQISVPDKLDIL